jgi:hypothetical protein
MHPIARHEIAEGARVPLVALLTLSSALAGGWSSTPRPGPFNPGKEPLFATVEEAGWTSGPIWTGVQKK